MYKQLKEIIMEFDKFRYISNEEVKLRNNLLNNKNYKISDNDRYNLASDLIKISKNARNDIIEISFMLNKNKNDSFYIPYSILTEYMSYQISHKNSDLEMDFLEKDEVLNKRKRILQIAMENNSKFIEDIYKEVRYNSSNIIFSEVQFSKLQKKHNEEKEINKIINTLKNIEK